MCVASTHSSERLHITALKISEEFGLPLETVGKVSACKCREARSLGWEDPTGGKGDPLQYPCPEKKKS